MTRYDNSVWLGFTLVKCLSSWSCGRSVHGDSSRICSIMWNWLWGDIFPSSKDEYWWPCFHRAHCPSILETKTTAGRCAVVNEINEGSGIILWRQRTAWRKMSKHHGLWDGGTRWLEVVRPTSNGIPNLVF